MFRPDFNPGSDPNPNPRSHPSFASENNLNRNPNPSSYHLNPTLILGTADVLHILWLQRHRVGPEN